ncbi:MAG: beta-ketoacyl-[acyl-carrier-protein] synthase family protein [Pirellulales bacterium]
MSAHDSVWITGAGCVSPLGKSPAQLIDRALAGHSGIRQVTRFPVTNHPSQIAAYLDDVPAPLGWDEAEFATRPLSEKIVLWCAIQALRDAGLWDERSRYRIGLVLGVGAEWLTTWTLNMEDANAILQSAQDEEVGLTARSFEALGIAGPSTTVAAACASGNYALGVGRQWVRQGLVDVCLAGGVEFAVSAMGLAGFGNLGALSRRNADPPRASRPFDSGRDGFVMGEGGALMVLESASHARRRGVAGRGEIAGFGASSDAFHAVIPSDDPAPAARAIDAALRDAQVAPSEVDYINAHATSTPVGDVHETKALGLVFGDEVRRVSISSTKSMTGHALSAASALEALLCLGALERQVVPPTINLEDVDPQCAHLNHVRNVAREQRVNVAISNSFGFGGANTCVVLRKAA